MNANNCDLSFIWFTCREKPNCLYPLPAKRIGNSNQDRSQMAHSTQRCLKHADEQGAFSHVYQHSERRKGTAVISWEKEKDSTLLLSTTQRGPGLQQDLAQHKVSSMWPRWPSATCLSPSPCLLLTSCFPPPSTTDPYCTGTVSQVTLSSESCFWWWCFVTATETYLKQQKWTLSHLQVTSNTLSLHTQPPFCLHQTVIFRAHGALSYQLQTIFWGFHIT